jgi:hypothetical protein
VSYTQTRYFAYPSFPAGRLAQAMRELLEPYSPTLCSVRVTLSETLPDNGTQTRRGLAVSALEPICDFRKKEMSTFVTAATGEEIALILRGIGDFLLAGITCEHPSTANTIFARLQTMLSLTEVHLEHTSLDDPSENRGKVFIGHGRSPIWRELKDLIEDRLGLDCEEFNRESTAGKTTVDRLKEMLKTASFAFLIMTGEDEHADRSLHARENVIHEIGLFQGRLDFEKAIVLIEEGCEEFSNIHGLSQIRFPRGNIMAKSEEIRQVLEREGIVKPDKST